MEKENMKQREKSFIQDGLIGRRRGTEWQGPEKKEENSKRGKKENKQGRAEAKQRQAEGRKKRKRRTPGK